MTLIKVATQPSGNIIYSTSISVPKDTKSEGSFFGVSINTKNFEEVSSNNFLVSVMYTKIVKQLPTKIQKAIKGWPVAIVVIKISNLGKNPQRGGKPADENNIKTNNQASVGFTRFKKAK